MAAPEHGRIGNATCVGNAIGVVYAFNFCSLWLLTLKGSSYIRMGVLDGWEFVLLFIEGRMFTEYSQFFRIAR